MSEQDEKDEKQRRASLRKTEEAIRAVMGNDDGLARLRALSDEEWEQAAKADEGAVSA